MGIALVSWETRAAVLKHYRMLSRSEATVRQLVLASLVGLVLASLYFLSPISAEILGICCLTYVGYTVLSDFLGREMLLGYLPKDEEDSGSVTTQADPQSAPPAPGARSVTEGAPDDEEALYAMRSKTAGIIRLVSSDCGFALLKGGICLVLALPLIFLFAFQGPYVFAALFIIITGALYLMIVSLLVYIEKREIDEFPEALSEKLMLSFFRKFADSRGCYFIGVVDNKTIGLPRMQRFMHTLIVGPTGSEKSTSSIIPQLLFDAESIGSAVVPDAKSPELFNWVAGRWLKYGKKVFLFDCWSPETVAINFLPEADDNDLLTFVDVMMRERQEAIGKEEAFFKSRTRYFLYAVLKLVQTFKAEYCNLSSVYRVLSNVDTLIAFIDSTGDDIKSLFSDFMKMTNETKVNTVNSIREKLEIFMDAGVRAAFSKSEFKLEMLFKEKEPCLLVLGAPIDKREPGQKISSLIVNLIINMAFRERRLQKQAVQRGIKSFTPNDLYLYLDELRSLQITALADLVSIARETKTHVCGSVTDLGFFKYYLQDFSSLLGNFRNRIILRGCDYDSAKYISDSLGKEDVTTYRFFRGIMAAQENRNVLDPNKVSELPDDQMIVFAPKTAPFVARKATIHRTPWLKKMKVPAPHNLRNLYAEWGLAEGPLADPVLPMINGHFDFEKIKSSRPVTINEAIKPYHKIFEEMGGGKLKRIDVNRSTEMEDAPQPQADSGTDEMVILDDMTDDLTGL